MNVVSLVFVILAGLLIFTLPNLSRQQFLVTSSGIIPMRNLPTVNEQVFMEDLSGTPSSSASGPNCDDPKQASGFKDKFEMSSYQREDLYVNTENELEDSSESQSVQNAVAVLQLNAKSLNQAESNENNSSSNEINPSNTEHSRLHSVQYKQRSARDCLKTNFQPIWLDFLGAYNNFYILKWSIWCFIMTAVYLQLIWYAPHQWQTLANEAGSQHIVRKGSIEAVTYFLACLVTFFTAFWKINWRILSDIVLPMSCLVIGLFCIIMSFISSLWFSYITFGVFMLSYQVLYTIAAFEIASQITTAKYALVFGFNNFTAGFIHMVLMLFFIVIHQENPLYTEQMLLTGVIQVTAGIGYLVNLFFIVKKDGLQNYIQNLKEHRYSIAHSHI